MRSPAAPDDAARAELAPSGKLRPGMNLCNRLLTFVEDVNASEFVARSIARHGVHGLSAVK